MSEPVSVRVRDCACPDQPHDTEGDLVYLLPVLSLEGGIQAELDIEAASRLGNGDQRVASDTLRRKWVVTFVRYGAIGWNWLGEAGVPVPFDVDALLADYSIARPISEKANELYFESVYAPFLKRQAEQSRNGQTPGSISPRGQSTHSRRKRSSPGTSAGSKRSAGRGR